MNSSFVSQFEPVPNSLRLAKGRKYLFVDGAFFIHRSRKMNERIHQGKVDLELDWQKIFEGYSRVFFYDALPVKKDEADEDFEKKIEAKSNLHSELRKLPNVHVREGKTKYQKRMGLKQKGVDIYLATEAITNAMQGNMEIAVFMFSDLDFYPLLNALTSTRVQTFVIYDKYVTAQELLECADVSIPLSGDLTNHWTLNPVSDFRASRIVKVPPHVTPTEENCDTFIVDSSWGSTPFKQNYTVLYDSKDYYWYVYGAGDDPVVKSKSKYLALERMEQVDNLHPMSLTKALDK